MTAWRLAREPYADLSGEGARRSGARWNPRGRATVYAADHPALAVCEYLVHVGDPDAIPDDLIFLRIDVPDAIPRESVDASELATDWREVGSIECVARGSAWLDAGVSAVLVVPSAIIPIARNVLLNPAHADARKCRVVERIPYRFEPRLLSVAKR